MAYNEEVQTAIKALIDDASEEYQAAPMPKWFHEPVSGKTYTSEQVALMAVELQQEGMRLGTIRGLSLAQKAVRRPA